MKRPRMTARRYLARIERATGARAQRRRAAAEIERLTRENEALRIERDARISAGVAVEIAANAAWQAREEAKITPPPIEFDPTTKRE